MLVSASMLVARSSAAIALGNQLDGSSGYYHNLQFAWVDGDSSPCASTIRAKLGEVNVDNSCDHPFNLLGAAYKGYQLHGCGTDNFEIWQNGKFNSKYHWLGSDVKIQCWGRLDVQHTYSCY